jgi:hypothetical protein
MRILTVPEQPAAPSPNVPSTVAPAFDVTRVAALERIVQSFREKILALEERLQTLERAPQSRPVAMEPARAPVPAPRVAHVPIPELALDAEAFKKNLLTKMWKYLNDDERPAKAV